MIKIENVEVKGWEAALRGMRNPMNSWEKSDSTFDSTEYHIGPNDNQLMMKLANGGPVHAKYRRMIIVYMDITAPLYWWKEFDTYKVGTVANSCSTMHKIHEKEFEMSDFSYDHLIPELYSGVNAYIDVLNTCRELFLDTKDKKYWWQMIQLLPSSYNQKRTIMLDYEVLANIYKYRKNHKLDEWVEFCDMIEELPYSSIITAKEVEES